MFKTSFNKRSFARNDDGSVAIIFAITLLVVLFLVGIAIDSARAYYATSKTMAALDSAALAAAKAMNEDGLDDAELFNVANTYFQSNVEKGVDKGVNFGALNLETDRERGAVTLSVEASVDTTFTAIMSIEKIDFSRSSTVVYNIRDVELSLMLDITGSMCSPCSKINDLKTAANELVDILIPDLQTANSTKIAIAPYAAAINAGPYADDVSDDVSVDGCVFERSGAGAYDDRAPGSGSYLSAMPNPSQPTNNHYGCPQSQVLALTDDKTRLRDNIDDLQTGGWTAGHLGAAWAWYLISPEWADIWPGASRPVAYNTADTVKAVVLMTDGKFNTSYLNGQQNQTSSNQATNLCDNMKDLGVVVYAVAFQAPSSAEQTLRDCASSDEHYFEPQNGDDLIGAFRDIAIRLAKLRIAS